jgi:hypothetical protein
MVYNFDLFGLAIGKSKQTVGELNATNLRTIAVHFCIIASVVLYGIANTISADTWNRSNFLKLKKSKKNF